MQRRHESLLRDPDAVLPLVRWLLCDTRRTYSEWRLGKAIAVKLGERAFTECLKEWYDEAKGKATAEEPPASKGIVGKDRATKKSTAPEVPPNEQPQSTKVPNDGGVA